MTGPVGVVWITRVEEERLRTALADARATERAVQRPPRPTHWTAQCLNVVLVTATVFFLSLGGLSRALARKELARDAALNELEELLERLRRRRAAQQGGMN